MRPSPSLRLTRRQALLAGAGMGLSIEFLAGRALASDVARTERRLVVIVARGGLDGLSLSPPVGDPDYAALRGPIALAPFGASDGALRLDETFGLHPAMPATWALARDGQARIAPAVATPDRERSHFEAQDVLESGAGTVYGTASGWLNRALQVMGPAGSVRALAVGATTPLILRGPIEAAAWAPGGAAERDPRLPAILQDLYARDALLGPALASGLATESLAKLASRDAAQQARPVARAGSDLAMQGQTRGGAGVGGKLDGARRLGATLAGFLTEPEGARVAAVAMDGFDTHANQGAAEGLLATRLAGLDGFLDGLHTGLGAAWSTTVVVMATEFGRTARINGTGGTDHGTGSTALLLGGALKPGGIVGDWPSLAQAKLFENRDTTPTLDMRGLFKGVLRDHLGVDRPALDRLVFPDSARVAPVAGLV